MSLREPRTDVSKRLYLIHNPVAGFLKRNKLARLLAVLREHGHQIHLRSTERAGHAELLVGELNKDEADIIVAAGGDGTVCEIANGMRPDHPPLAFLPLGTANVLAWEIGIGLNPKRALAALETGKARPVFPGLIDGRKFLLMASAGIDARVVETAHGPLKRTFGQLGFVIAALMEIVTKQSDPIVADVDGVIVEADLIVVTRAKRYGGPFIIAPDANLSEPGLWVIAPKRRGRLALLRYAIALVLGKLATLEDVLVTPAEKVTFTAPVGHPVQVDGDIFTQIPATVTACQDKIDILYPTIG